MFCSVEIEICRHVEFQRGCADGIVQQAVKTVEILKLLFLCLVFPSLSFLFWRESRKAQKMADFPDWGVWIERNGGRLWGVLLIMVDGAQGARKRRRRHFHGWRESHTCDVALPSPWKRWTVFASFPSRVKVWAGNPASGVGPSALVGARAGVTLLTTQVQGGERYLQGRTRAAAWKGQRDRSQGAKAIGLSIVRLRVFTYKIFSPEGIFNSSRCIDFQNSALETVGSRCHPVRWRTVCDTAWKPPLPWAPQCTNGRQGLDKWGGQDANWESMVRSSDRTRAHLSA